MGKDVNDIRSFFVRNFYKYFVEENVRDKSVKEYFKRQDNWNDIKRKYGLIVQTIALIAMFGLIWYTVVNVNTLATHPCRVCEDLGYVCHAPILYKCEGVKECSDYLTKGGCEEDPRTCKTGVNPSCKTLLEKYGELWMREKCGCYWNEVNQSCEYSYELRQIETNESESKFPSPFNKIK